MKKNISTFDVGYYSPGWFLQSIRGDVIFMFLLSVALVAISYWNYLVFHVLTEFFAIGVAFIMFIIAWHTYSFSQNHFLLILGVGYFWIAWLDTAHTLFYFGMPTALDEGNLTSQFWVTTRFLESVLLFLSPYFLDKSINRNFVITLFGVIAAAIPTMIFLGIIPDTFVAGEGLTPFKIFSEYIIIAVLIGSIFHLKKHRRLLDPKIYQFIVASIILTISAELAFTFYVSMYGLSNLVGHLFKIYSFWLIYVAIIRTSLSEPFSILDFRLKIEISERRQAEKNLKEHQQILEKKIVERTCDLQLAKDQAEKASQAKSEFLGTMSHELFTPLHAITGMLDLASRTPLNEKQQRYIKKSRHSAESLVGIIGNILEFSNLDTGKFMLKKTAFDLENIIEDFDRKIRDKAGEKGIELSIVITHDGPKELIGDPLCLSQVLNKLGDNAVKFTDKGGKVSAHIEIKEQDEKLSLFHFVVSDTGIGMTEEQKKALFNPFKQVDNSSTRKHGGIGLGLVIAKKLTQMMEGNLWVESEFGKGSAFHLAIPFHKIIEYSVDSQLKA